ncbi:hypothetical protein GCM10020219_041490 [Nonomuraea dietziae]
MPHPVRRCDAAIGLGSHDLGVADVASDLYHAGLFPTLVFSGATSPTTAARFPRGEAVHYRERALKRGVPDEAILLETRAGNTGQNVTLSRQVLAEAGVEPRSVLLISKPYMERRAYATARQVWPEVEVVCASEPLEFDDYIKAIGDDKLVVDMLVGDLQRVIEYPKLGFAIEQDVPGDVYDAKSLFSAPGSTAASSAPEALLAGARRVAIHQPNLFPRLTTLAKLWAADCWVVLDNVQFARGTTSIAPAWLPFPIPACGSGCRWPRTCPKAARRSSGTRGSPTPHAASGESGSCSSSSTAAATGRCSRSVWVRCCHCSTPPTASPSSRSRPRCSC